MNAHIESWASLARGTVCRSGSPCESDGGVKECSFSSDSCQSHSLLQSLDLELWKLDGIADPLPILEVNTSGWTRIEDRVMVIGSPEQGGAIDPLHWHDQC